MPDDLDHLDLVIVKRIEKFKDTKTNDTKTNDSNEQLKKIAPVIPLM